MRRVGHYAKPDWRAALAGYWRDPLANTGEPLRQGILSGILGAIHYRATLGYSAGYWRDPLPSYSGILSGILGGIYWRAALVGYSAGSSNAGGILGGIHWRATLGYSAGYSAGSTGCSGGILGGIHWQAALAGYSAGSTGEPLWWDTRRGPLASSSGGILGGIHWRAALAGYWAGSTGEQLWRDTRWDPLSCSGGILGGIHCRAALAGYWVGAWCRSIANADSNIKSNNPFLSGGQKQKKDSVSQSLPNQQRTRRLDSRVAFSATPPPRAAGTGPRPHLRAPASRR